MLHYTTNLCAMKNSPLVIGIAHSLKVIYSFNKKDVLTTLVSIILFNDIKINIYIILGFTISFMGSLLYSY